MKVWPPLPYGGMTLTEAAPLGAQVLILSGRGRYEDPWHDHAAISYEIARLVLEIGCRVEVRGVFPDAFADLDRHDLIVVNSGCGRPDPSFDGDDEAWAANHEALAAYVDAGNALLGLHQAANTFSDSPHWFRILGGRWVPDVSGHPPISDATISVRTGVHPIVRDLSDFVVFDERYCDLQIDEASQVLATQRHEGRDHPIVWVTEQAGGRRVYDALGHDTRSFASPGRRDLLRREIQWLLGVASH